MYRYSNEERVFFKSKRFIYVTRDLTRLSESGQHRIQEIWFKQYEAPPHPTRDALDLIRSHYDNRVIAKGFLIRFGYELPPPPLITLT